MPDCKSTKSPQSRLGLTLLLALMLSFGPTQASELEIAQRQWLAGKRPQAIATIEEALLKTPNELKLRFALGVMRMEQGEQAAALGIFASLTQDFPDLADPFNNLAVLHASMGELDQAQQALEQALNLQPTHAQAQENLGDVLLRLALRAYQRSQQAQIAPTNSLALKISLTQDLLQAAKLGKP
jgi:tetratricopeptide (TPR) repeat protein